MNSSSTFIQSTLITTSVLLGFASAPAQDRWLPAGSEPASANGAMVYDSARGEVVLQSSSGATHVWTGTNWRIAATAGPAGALDAAFDAIRGRMVVYRGDDGQTFEWDGTNWALVSTAGPAARFDPAMGFDQLSGRVLLHGGGPGGIFNPAFTDTWEWDGTNWNQLATGGPQLAHAAMTFDLNRNRMIMFGGYATSGAAPFSPSAITWEWNGTSWTQLPALGPAGGRCRMVFDLVRQKVLLSALNPGILAPPYTWLWDGTTWTQAAGSSITGVFPITEMAYDISNGYALGIHQSGTWSWNGTWALAAAPPPAVGTQAMTYDSARQRLVMCIGNSSAQTWEWDGAWQVVATGGPAASSRAAMAFDPVRGRSVLFGGTLGPQPNDTWEWDGTTWTASPAAGPTTRSRHAMAFDPVTQRVLLAGGSVPDNQTWAWDGSSWSVVSTQAVVNRSDLAMATDFARNRVVMFGGRTTTELGDTWEWDGATWTQMATAGPQPRYRSAMAWDEARGRVVLHGGQSGATALGDTWEWDGQSWRQLMLTSPGARSDLSSVYDTRLQRVVLFGLPAAGGLHLLDAASVGSGCAGTAGVPSVTLDTTRPSINGTLQATVTGIPAIAPVFFALGFDLTLPPVSLAPFGMPGCSQLVQPIGNVMRVAVGGQATLTLQIPNAPSALGVRIVEQAVVVDPGANPLGLVTGNAVAAVVTL